MMHDEFLRDVELFLAASGMSPTRFGLTALNDREFVRRLRRGSDIRLSTIEKVRSFMNTHGSEARQGHDATA